MAATCPYCGVAIAQAPKRAAKCKACKETIYVRSVEGELDKRLFTDVQADDFDADRDHTQDKKRATKLVHELLDEIPIPKGSKPARIASAIAKYEKLTVWNEKKQIASMLATCAHADNLNPHQWAIEAAICQLKQFATMPSWHDHLFIYNGCRSPICAELEDKKFTLEEAFAEMPIPSRHCTNKRNSAGFAHCQCTWMVDLDSVRLEREKQPARTAEEYAAALKRLAVIGIAPPGTRPNKSTIVRNTTALYLNGLLLVASILVICAIAYF